MATSNGDVLGVVAMLALVGCAMGDEPPPPPVPSELLISDYRANAIFRYDGVTGAPAGVFAQGSAQRVDRPASVRLGPDGQLYAAGFGRGEVVRYDAHSGAMMDVFFWDTAELEEPVELMFRGDELIVLGNDTNNAVVIGPDGVIARSFGYPHIRGAHDFAVGGDDRMYIATDRAIQVWDIASGTQLPALASTGELAMAVGIALDPDGVIHVADWERGRITRHAADGTDLGVLIDGLVNPISLDFGPDGALYVMDARGVHRHDARTGDHLALLVARDDRLLYPRSFTFVSDAALGR
ncbi:MAG: hypothetical protein H0X17_05165 [Deltaproteobacteria bacterium]|nr:hypothetical protein [Deltaproteobacteria bacterium]